MNFESGFPLWFDIHEGGMDGGRVGIPVFLFCFTFLMSALLCAVSIGIGGR